MIFFFFRNNLKFRYSEKTSKVWKIGICNSKFCGLPRISELHYFRFQISNFHLLIQNWVNLKNTEASTFLLCDVNGNRLPPFFDRIPYWATRNVSIGRSIALDLRKSEQALWTLIGMRGDTFISLYFLDQILSAEFLSKNFKLFWR